MMTRLAALAPLALLAACGGDGGSTGPDGGDPGNARLTARIDGAAWAATAASTSTGVTLVLPGVYTMTGVSAGANPIVIAISLYNIGGPGTYPIGVGPQVAGGSVVLSNTTGGWASPMTGADGSITISALTATRIAGTFNFTVNALSGSATGTRTVTDGTFDLEVKANGTVGPLPDNAGSKVSATIGATSFNAAFVAGTLTPGTNILSVAANNSVRGIGITITGLTAPGTYPFSSASPVRSLSVSNVANTLANTWHSNGAGSSGSITVTSITPTRIRGTFSGTLGPAPGTQTTGTITVTNGTFDVGRP